MLVHSRYIFFFGKYKPKKQRPRGGTTLLGTQQNPAESGLYYLQSRYYNPEVGRFLNADSFASTGQGLLGNNVFAYCLNNPVNASDPTGGIAISTLILIGSVIAGIGSAGYTAYTTYQAGWETSEILWYTFGSGLGTFLTVYSFGTSLYQVYQNYCAIRGTTPVTDIGKSTPVSQPAQNPLEYVTYTEKVNQQRQQGDYHSFPDIVDNYGAYGQRHTIIGGDGQVYTKLLIPGEYRGKGGFFTYIWDSQYICNHRLFEKN